MTPVEIIKGLYDETMVGNKPAVLELTQEGIDSGLPPERMLFEALIPSLEEVGARFERGEVDELPGDQVLHRLADGLPHGPDLLQEDLQAGG